MAASPPHLRQVLRLWDATCVVVGAIIGVGIFFNPRDVATLTGSAPRALLAWALGGLIALLGAFTFAELGRLRPVAGGQYHVLRDTYGRLPAFLFVFCNLTAIQAGAVAIIAIVCAQHLGVALHGQDPSARWVLVMATVFCWALVALNVLGVRTGAKVQNVTVIAKLLTLGALVVLAAIVKPGAGVPVAPAAPAAPAHLSGLFAGMALTLFAYGGWQQAMWVAGEVVDARRTVPRAILLGVGIVIVAYLAANWAYLDLLGFDGVRHAKALVADAFSVAWPGVGRRIAAAAVAASAFGVLNAQFLTGPRLTWAMASDGLFFAPFARILEPFDTPAAAILLLGALATALVLGLGLDRTDLLTTGVVVVDSVFFALSGLALPALRRRTPAAERGPAWLDAAAIAFAALELLAIVGSVLERNVRVVALTGLAWIGVAALVWAVWFRGRPAPARTDAPAGG
ncbi:MAG: APC family permease [Candidatus Eisenbacteria bacterium]|uniref:APC family permease n=1 Tax=Eiseniibacteriota bacterium TaxID=2212470 RepID=A0A538U5F7_UNCEI|nr:MAG: APC family permease [Candidatus Eisenbacteria bacterium]